MNELKGFRVPQSRADIGEAEVEAVAHTLRSGWLTAGPAVHEFETAFQNFLGGSVDTIATSSASLGLMVALKALGVGPGDEVITTTNTFVATAMSAHHLGAKPVLVDIDSRTLTIDPERVEAAVTPRTRVVLPVHLGGLACDMDAIHDIATRHRLSVVEDAAHALPTTWRGRMVGAGASAATVFSFYATKSITTGEGGMITTADPDLARRMRRLRQHGIDRDAFHRLNNSSWEYDVCEAGFKANMTDIAASLGLVQLRKLDGMWRRRDQIARRYRAALADLPVQLPAAPLPGDTHAWHLFIIQLLPDAPLGRDAFITAMNARRIQCGVHYPPLHRHSFWRSTPDAEPGNFPEAEKVFSRTVTLPLFSAMSDEDVNYVVDAVRSLLT